MPWFPPLEKLISLLRSMSILVNQELGLDLRLTGLATLWSAGLTLFQVLLSPQ